MKTYKYTGSQPLLVVSEDVKTTITAGDTVVFTDKEIQQTSYYDGSFIEVKKKESKEAKE